MGAYGPQATNEADDIIDAARHRVVDWWQLIDGTLSDDEPA